MVSGSHALRAGARQLGRTRQTSGTPWFPTFTRPSSRSIGRPYDFGPGQHPSGTFWRGSGCPHDKHFAEAAFAHLRQEGKADNERYKMMSSRGQAIDGEGGRSETR